ncbi:hypothetical protein ACFYVR_15820 [Rhodococcus sp. NPDC003318]|uniref:hypothetical protein n=1 Tax=Rhodococcus sp. NPDC003318 TaxID=3364503 RepID=UPI0036B79367
MFKFLRRKADRPSTPLDVLGDAPAMWPTMPDGDPDSDLAGGVPASELIARLRAEYAEQVTA